MRRSLTERVVRSRLQRAGHVERMADDRLPKRAAELREQGRRRRGRPRLRWEDCIKKDERKAGEEEDWKKKIRDRGWWKRLSYEAVKKLRAAPRSARDHIEGHSTSAASSWLVKSRHSTPLQTVRETQLVDRRPSSPSCGCTTYQSFCLCDELISH